MRNGKGVTGNGEEEGGEEEREAEEGYEEGHEAALAVVPSSRTIAEERG